MDSRADAVASRRLLLNADGDTKDVLVEIFAPTRSVDGRHFECVYQISGLGSDLRHRDEMKFESLGRGIDSIQALISAIKMIESDLRPLEQKLKFENDFGEHGFPLVFEFLEIYGVEFRDHIRDVIDHEVDQFLKKKYPGLMSS